MDKPIPETPRKCMRCDEPLLPDDPHSEIMHMHRECGLRSIMGGANHLLKQCHCYGGTLDPDPPNLTIREAAAVAMAIFVALPTPKEKGR
jgi:hypothetical protein